MKCVWLMDMGFTEYLRGNKWEWEQCALKQELEGEKAEPRADRFFLPNAPRVCKKPLSLLALTICAE